MTKPYVEMLEDCSDRWSLSFVCIRLWICCVKVQVHVVYLGEFLAKPKAQDVKQPIGAGRYEAEHCTHGQGPDEVLLNVQAVSLKMASYLVWLGSRAFEPSTIGQSNRIDNRKQHPCTAGGQI